MNKERRKKRKVSVFNNTQIIHSAQVSRVPNERVTLHERVSFGSQINFLLSLFQTNVRISTYQGDANEDDNKLQ